MRPSSLYLFTLCVSTLLSWSRITLASTVYPIVLREELGLDKEPDCQLCHTTERGGPNTAKQPFAQVLSSKGLTGSANVESLREVLAELGDSDSDRDGVADTVELERGSDPNDDMSVPDEPETTPPDTTLDSGSVVNTDAGAAASNASLGQSPGETSRSDAVASFTTDASTAIDTPSPESSVGGPPKSAASKRSDGGCSMSRDSNIGTGGWLVMIVATLFSFKRKWKWRSSHPWPLDCRSEP